MSYLLQATDWSSSCYLSGGNQLSCVLDALTGAFGGEALFGLLVGGLLFLGLFVAGGGDISTPTVVLILTGGVLVPMLPAGYQSIAYNIAIVGVTGAVLTIAHRYVLSGATR